MANQFKSNYRKVKLSRHEAEEFGSKKGLVFCGECKAVYYKKSWHHSLLGLKSVKEDSAVSFRRCPACEMIKAHQFEGRIRITGVPDNLMAELLNLIKGFGERAREADPLDRVIDIKKTKENLLVTTTENQLANKLAKKIQNTFNGVRVRTTFSKAPSDFVDIKVEFLSS